MKPGEFFVGKPVTSLQTMLRTVAEVERKIPSVVPDGIYGADTMRSLQAFQRQKGLPVTGIANQETWDALVPEYERAAIEVGQAAPLLPILNKRQVFLPGSTNYHVRLIQALLRTLAEFYPQLPVVDVNGVYDDKTVNCVKWLQRRNGQPESGIFDKQTWKLLTSLYRNKVGNGER